MKLKRKHIILIAAAALLLGACGIFICVKATEMPIDKCMQTVESVKFDKDEVIKYEGIDEYSDGEALNFSSDIADYMVNSETGKIEFMLRYDIYASSFSVTIDEARNKAAEYVRLYRPDMETDDMVLTLEEQYDSRFEYSFRWETIINDVHVGRSVSVDISGNGEMIALICCGDEKITEPDLRNVTVDKEKAEKTAMNYVGDNFSEISCIEMRLMEGKVVWEVGILCKDDPDGDICEYYGLTIYIDAETGKIIEAE